MMMISKFDIHKCTLLDNHGDKKKRLLLLLLLKFKWDRQIRLNDQIVYLLYLVDHKNLIDSSSMFFQCNLL